MRKPSRSTADWRGIRLTGGNQQWGEHLPLVSAARASQSPVFNAQGSPPYMLAGGRRAAEPQGMPLDELIPQALRATLPLRWHYWL